ncbi:MAG: hypothetical protein H7249_05755 [Chitinophagaceae bacterium]|nr:hypothetical protein [Oligoflexus sp.]
MVGNVWEWTSGQQLSAAGQDNGTDGLWYGVTLPGGASNISAFKMDLMRAYPSSSALSTIADNSDFYNYASSLGGSIRGGNWGYGAGSGRWTLAQHRPPSLVAWYLGQRCSL